MEAIPILVAAGRIVHQTLTGVPAFRRDDIALVPIRDLPPIPLELIWRAGHDNNARTRAPAEVVRRSGPPASRR